jgi:hypothetical protein
MPLNDVSTVVYYRSPRLYAEDGAPIAAIAPSEYHYDNIPPMRSATLTFPLSVPGMENIDIDIVVFYKPAWWPFTKRETFRFTTKTANDGSFHWLPRPD